ncbi:MULTISPECIES: phosphomannomutase [unclassified Pseudomonas]|uniref:phosphomannomutase n=1 Tax=unclassified Pseudomonas TaxID=196821 RepID=UPI00191459AE|nr:MULTISPECIES: phosphomannomutase [unclassified Pseudomonas]MBK5553028.1 phosphomannomutase [Pseudomonas sp. TH03]MEB0225213.1 phosphomannomutase [Pseudomonas sp. 5S1]MEB0298357.1 phosphomannomutase [Pseudomonas sp. 10S4]WPX16995.1 phosphomannomutase [Pseudomonas sp. 10S4]
MKTLSGFKAGDSRQPYGADLKNNLAYLIVRAYASELIFPRAPKTPALLVERIGVFPSSGEIRREVKDGATLLASIKNCYITQALEINEDDGLSLVFADWRFSLCLSGNGGTTCLNVESRGDITLMQRKTVELLEQIDAATD